jgi:hypothetical protein
MADTMKLKIIQICDPRFGEDLFKEWVTANPGARIKHVVSNHHGACDNIFILYEDPAEQHDRALAEQTAEMLMNRDVARAIQKDPRYGRLPNQKQRILYMLAKYNLPKDDAEMVDNLLQMARSGALEL